MIMFAKGEYAIAASLVEDVVDIERERSKARKPLVSSLIKALQFSGIVYVHTWAPRRRNSGGIPGGAAAEREPSYFVQRACSIGGSRGGAHDKPRIVGFRSQCLGQTEVSSPGVDNGPGIPKN